MIYYFRRLYTIFGKWLYNLVILKCEAVVRKNSSPQNNISYRRISCKKKICHSEATIIHAEESHAILEKDTSP